LDRKDWNKRLSLNARTIPTIPAFKEKAALSSNGTVDRE
jgi:hypothetical protein